MDPEAGRESSSELNRNWLSDKEPAIAAGEREKTTGAFPQLYGVHLRNPSEPLHLDLSIYVHQRADNSTTVRAGGSWRRRRHECAVPMASIFAAALVVTFLALLCFRNLGTNSALAPRSRFLAEDRSVGSHICAVRLFRVKFFRRCDGRMTYRKVGHSLLQ